MVPETIQVECHHCRGSGIRTLPNPGGIRTIGDLIVYEVSAEFGVSMGDVRGRRRYASVSHARFKAAARLYHERGFMLKHIGMALGGKDHASVIHALKRAYELGLYPRPYVPRPYSRKVALA